MPARSRTREDLRALDGALAGTLDDLARRGLHRDLLALGPRRGVVVSCDGRDLVDFSSNDYLGLASDPAVAAAASSLDGGEAGAGAARLISGNREEHEALERELADLKGTEAALLFGSGYLANAGAIPALAERGDVIYADERNHASLIDGCRLSRAERRIYPHGDVGALGRMLATDEHRFRRRWIVTDGMFSMEGDLAPLPDLAALAREHDAWLYLDDAHGTGVLGPGGGGMADHFGLRGEIEAQMGTLGKALGTAGAFIAGSRVLVEYLRHRARTFVFTTASPPLLARAARVALAEMRARPALRSTLAAHAARLRAGLGAMGYAPSGFMHSPIVPVLIGDATRAATIGAALRERGFLAGTIRPPTVLEGTSRLRMTVSAVHTAKQIDAVVGALGDLLSAPA